MMSTLRLRELKYYLSKVAHTGVELRIGFRAVTLGWKCLSVLQTLQTSSLQFLSC